VLARLAVDVMGGAVGRVVGREHLFAIDDSLIVNVTVGC
jgi:hypothetical protein